ncbi:hypothetical protein JL107_01770 [Nakamurella flavida]|uniref:Actinobacteria/chloroflexi VLRF1 release factor domain-containing protein n=1 Tax=Nakamurella flavida TaxID=363630 RepID=A0A938YLD7_9ACTN|nr:acVLRF1 family peptidyl-tRNA hydrolase [Nakamurella flavida]MBM9475163.1 hypothetical protein [Nakamurella flavida]MDP9776736.1 hypothetical protein [Nakamurella flavida]
MTSRARPAPGGGTVVEIAPERLVGWVNRFSGRNDGLADITADADGVTVQGGDGTTARLQAPFGPMDPAAGEPLEALLAHLAHLGGTGMGLILVRAGAHSVGVARDGRVLSSSTDRAYVQGRTAAGGWSQQRFARRRGNQRTAALEDSADAAARVLGPLVTGPAAAVRLLVTAGDGPAVTEVLSDPRLAAVAALPRRHFGDIAEPRRAVLDEVAGRSLAVEILVRGVDPPMSRARVR